MELLERYLQAIRTYLPAKSAADITSELRENLLSQMEEQSDLLGRPLNPDEQAAIIQRHGHPVLVAARYAPQRQLIGPTVFPFYWLTLRAALLIALVVRAVAVLLAILISKDNQSALIPQVLAIPAVMLPVFAIVTLVFAVLEQALSSRLVTAGPAAKINWKPASLPALRRSQQIVPRTESAAGLIFGMAAAIWWQATPAAPFLIFGPAAFLVNLAPIWSAVHTPILCLIVARALLCALDLLRPHISALRRWIYIALTATEAIVAAIIFRAGIWVVPALSLTDKIKAEQVARILNQSLAYTFTILLAITLFQLLKRCYRLYRNSRLDTAGTIAATFA